MSANWVTAAAQFGGQTLDLFAQSGGSGSGPPGLMALQMFGAGATSKLNRTLVDIEDRTTRRQIRIASLADANARIRATQDLISAQRAGLGASGIMGGRTARLLEAQARIMAGRQQVQADQSRLFAETASRMGRTIGRQQARVPLFKAAGDLLASFVQPPGQGSPGDI